MKLNKLPKATTRKKKRVGRGYGSGKGGHTVGRGQKGQKVRGKVGLLFEGTKMRKSLLKRLPMLRGKNKFKATGKKPIIVNLKYLNLLPSKAKVNIESLVKHKIVKEKDAKSLGVKILGDGEIKKPLTVQLPISKAAAEKIIKVGGKVEGEKQGNAKAPKGQKRKKHLRGGRMDSSEVERVSKKQVKKPTARKAPHAVKTPRGRQKKTKGTKATQKRQKGKSAKKA